MFYLFLSIGFIFFICFSLLANKQTEKFLTPWPMTQISSTYFSFHISSRFHHHISPEFSFLFSLFPFLICPPFSSGRRQDFYSVQFLLLCACVCVCGYVITQTLILLCLLKWKRERKKGIAQMMMMKMRMRSKSQKSLIFMVHCVHC